MNKNSHLIRLYKPLHDKKKLEGGQSMRAHRKYAHLHLIPHSMTFLTLNFVPKVTTAIQNLFPQANIVSNMNILRTKIRGVGTAWLYIYIDRQSLNKIGSTSVNRYKRNLCNLDIF